MRFLAPTIYLVLASLASAQTFTWSTTASTGSMTTGSNWAGGQAPATSGNGIAFNTSTTGNVVNDFTSLSVTSISLQGGATPFNLSGNAITLMGGVSVSDTSTIPVISADLVVSSTQSFFTPNGASLTVSGAISGTGGVTKTAGGTGVLTLSGANTFTGGFQSNNGTVRLAGAGTLGDSSGSININGVLDLNGTTQTSGLFNGGGTIRNDASDTTSTLIVGQGNATGGDFGGAISDHASGTGQVALVKTGTGTQTLSGANTFTGATSVNGGNLLVNGSLAQTAVSVGSGATLGGNGTIGGATTIQNGGTLAPGNSPGLLTFSSSLTLDSGSTATFEINGLNRGSTYDAVDVAGTTTLAGTLALSFASTIADGNSLQLFGGGGAHTGDFTSITASGAYSGTFTDQSGAWTLSSGGQTLSFSAATGNLTVASAVPEPSTYALLVGFVVLGCVALLRHRAGSQVTT